MPSDASNIPRQEAAIMDFECFRMAGLLWLVNRVVFHPRGYAMALCYDEDKNVVGWTLLGDGDEVWSFSAEDDDEQFERVRHFFAPE